MCGFGKKKKKRQVSAGGSVQWGVFDPGVPVAATAAI
jgi:hypothetical protein